MAHVQPDTLQPGDSIGVGVKNSLISAPAADGSRTFVTLQKDGTLAVYKYGPEGSRWLPAYWGSGTDQPPGSLSLGYDGNLVLMDAAGGVVWCPWKGGSHYAKVQPDGNFVLYNTDGTAPAPWDAFSDLAKHGLPKPVPVRQYSWYCDVTNTVGSTYTNIFVPWASDQTEAETKAENDIPAGESAVCKLFGPPPVEN